MACSLVKPMSMSYKKNAGSQRTMVREKSKHIVKKKKKKRNPFKMETSFSNFIRTENIYKAKSVR